VNRFQNLAIGPSRDNYRNTRGRSCRMRALVPSPRVRSNPDISVRMMSGRQRRNRAARSGSGRKLVADHDQAGCCLRIGR